MRVAAHLILARWPRCRCGWPTRAQFERRFIEVALARAGSSRSRAARELGLSRRGLLKTMKRLGLDTASGSAEEC